jgi:hypothetical protein
MSTLIHEHRDLIWWVAVLSGVVFAGSLVVVPWLVVRIPPDYFAAQKRRRTAFARQHRLLRWMGLIIKNLTGVLLVFAIHSPAAADHFVRGGARGGPRVGAAPTDLAGDGSGPDDCNANAVKRPLRRDNQTRCRLKWI